MKVTISKNSRTNFHEIKLKGFIICANAKVSSATGGYAVFNCG